MAKWVTTIAVAAALATLAGCSADTPTDNAPPASETRPAEGIDLRGGAELVYRIEPNEDGSEADGDLARRMIAILKQRVGPTGGGFEWRPIGKDRFSIRMPAGKGGPAATEDLKRLIARAGQLEFRVAPALPGTGADRMPIRREDYELYLKSLQDEGPDAGHRTHALLQWFPVRGKAEGFRGTVTGQHGEQLYMLLCTESDKTMLHRAGGWSLKRAYPTADGMGQPAIGFEFDPNGAKQVATLTQKHKDHFMAVLLDGTVYSCPIIREKISGRGIITGKFSAAEVFELVRVLEAGALPARLAPVPVSERTFAPDRREVAPK